MYCLLAGYPPFRGSTIHAVMDRINSAPLDLESKPWPKASGSAKRMVQHLLQRDPMHRASLEEALSHPWVQGSLQQGAMQAGDSERRCDGQPGHGEACRVEAVEGGCEQSETALEVDAAVAVAKEVENSALQESCVKLAELEEEQDGRGRLPSDLLNRWAWKAGQEATEAECGTATAGSGISALTQRSLLSFQFSQSSSLSCHSGGVRSGEDDLLDARQSPCAAESVEWDPTAVLCHLSVLSASSCLLAGSPDRASRMECLSVGTKSDSAQRQLREASIGSGLSDLCGEEGTWPELQFHHASPLLSGSSSAHCLEAPEEPGTAAAQSPQHQQHGHT